MTYWGGPLNRHDQRKTQKLHIFALHCINQKLSSQNSRLICVRVCVWEFLEVIISFALILLMLYISLNRLNYGSVL